MDKIIPNYEEYLEKHPDTISKKKKLQRKMKLKTGQYKKFDDELSLKQYYDENGDTKVKKTVHFPNMNDSFQAPLRLDENEMNNNLNIRSFNVKKKGQRIIKESSRSNKNLKNQEMNELSESKISKVSPIPSSIKIGSLVKGQSYKRGRASVVQKYNFKYYTGIDYSTTISKSKDITMPIQSRAAMVLNERTLKKLILLVLVMNGITTILSSEFYSTESLGFDFDIQTYGGLIKAGASQSQISNFTNKLMKRYEDKSFQIFRIESLPELPSDFTDPEISKLRESELYYSKFDDGEISV